MAIVVNKGCECWFINGDGVVAVHITKSQIVFKLFNGESVVAPISGIESERQLKTLAYYFGIHLYSDTVVDLDWILEFVKEESK